MTITAFAGFKLTVSTSRRRRTAYTKRIAKKTCGASSALAAFPRLESAVAASRRNGHTKAIGPAALARRAGAHDPRRLASFSVLQHSIAAVRIFGLA